MDNNVVIWDELVHGEQVVKSAQIFHHKVTKVFGAGNANRPSRSNLGCSDKITEVDK